MNKKKLISIVTPMYNESDNIDRYFTTMNAVLETLSDRYDFEYVITDNRSEDDTFAKIREHAKNDPRIHAYRFSRNYGYQRSILTGYCQARGSAAIEFDADLQDPPELLPMFLEQWEAGNQIVYGIRKSRQEGAIVGAMRRIFYRVINSLSEVPLPLDAGDFMLIDRCILDKLKDIRELNLYIRGIVFSMGFEKTGVPYDRRARVAGKSKFPFRKMLSLATDGIISQSVKPLRIASYCGVVVALLTMCLSIMYLVLYLLNSVALPPGFTTTILLLLLSFSFNAIFLGIIGEYIGRVYIQIKQRPITIIDEVIG
jgi:polyisoprenyl-phosphate glycosyltransferase